MNMTLTQLIQALLPAFRVFSTGDTHEGPDQYLSWHKKTFLLCARDSDLVLLLRLIEINDTILGQVYTETLKEISADHSSQKDGFGGRKSWHLSPQGVLESLGLKT